MTEEERAAFWKKTLASEQRKHLGIRKRSTFPKPPPGYNPWTRRIET